MSLADLLNQYQYVLAAITVFLYALVLGLAYDLFAVAAPRIAELKKQADRQEKNNGQISELAFAIQMQSGWLIHQRIDDLHIHVGEEKIELPVTVNASRIIDGEVILHFGKVKHIIACGGRTFDWIAEKIIDQIKMQLSGYFPPQDAQEAEPPTKADREEEAA